MASVSYYQILQVRPDASQEEIAAAYRRLARQVHPDLNPSPDAHRRMQVINEAYNTLRHPDRRQRYDDVRTAGAAQKPAAEPARAGGAATASARTHTTGAWLSYQKRQGAEIIFTVGHAENMAALLAELQRRIPPSSRRYEIAHNRWRVAVDYEDVLRTLFRNYAPVVQAAAPAAEPRRPDFARRQTRTVVHRRVPHTPGERNTWFGVGLVVVAGLVLYALLFGRMILSETREAPADAVSMAESETAPAEIAAADGDSTTFYFPEDCTSDLLAQAPAYFRAACRTLEDEPHAATPAPARPFALTTTRVASNIRSGPDTRFPVLTTAPAGSPIQLVGYTISRGYVWYLTNFGGWIRSDLVTDIPDFLPMVGSDELS